MRSSLLDQSIRVIHVDDDEVDHILVSRSARRAPGVVTLRQADSFEAMQALLQTEPADVVLLDLNFGPFRGFESLHAFRRMGLSMPVIVLTGIDEPGLGPAAVELGAEDLIHKDDLEPQTLWSVLCKARARWRGRGSDALALPLVGMPSSTGLRRDAVVGPYVVVGEIARGGMATVYRVRHRTLGSTHALKVVRSGVSVDQARLLVEGRVQARLRHPNLVAATDLIEFIDGARGLVMEFVAGPTLDRWLRTSSDLSGRSWFSIFVAATRGVHCAHLATVVHRDLKPSNVLLHRVHHGLVPKVADFGIAKVLEDDTLAEHPAGHHTRAGMALGTPGFMAPEQIADASTVDERADIFALGCLAFYMVSGRRPFPRGPSLSQLSDMMRGNVPVVTDFVPQASPLLSDVMRRAMSFDPADRYASCVELLRALDRLNPREIPDRLPIDDRSTISVFGQDCLT